jgi:hypothetical protein
MNFPEELDLIDKDDETEPFGEAGVDREGLGELGFTEDELLLGAEDKKLPVDDKLIDEGVDEDACPGE